MGVSTAGTKQKKKKKKKIAILEGLVFFFLYFVSQ